MPLPTINDCYRVALQWTDINFSRAAVNVMHFTKSSGTISDLYTKFDSHVTNTMFGQTTTAAGVDQVTITSLDGLDASVVFATGRPSKWKGQQTSTDVIPAAAAIVKLRTDKRGRSYRGRVFLPFVCELAQADGKLDSTIATNMSTAWTTFMNAMASDGWHLVVASYVLSTAETVAAVSVETYLGTQRKRQPRPS